MSNLLQILVNSFRVIIPRGWAQILKLSARLIPSLKEYKAHLSNDDYLYIDLSDRMCIGYFFHGGHPHEAGTEHFFYKYCKPGFSVMDIGANVGYYTRLASKLVGDGGKVLGFEPLPKAYNLLLKNTCDLDNTKIYKCGLSSSEGDTNFYIREAGDTSSLLVANSNEKVQEIIVSIKKADSFINEMEKVDFVKIDVEGYELEVLLGMTAIISKYRPIIIFEYLIGYGKKMGVNYSDFMKFFNKFNYSLHYINHTESSDFTLSETNMIAAIPFEKKSLY